jgi:hypothetical protein
MRHDRIDPVYHLAMACPRDGDLMASRHESFCPCRDILRDEHQPETRRAIGRAFGETWE